MRIKLNFFGTRRNVQAGVQRGDLQSAQRGLGLLGHPLARTLVQLRMTGRLRPSPARPQAKQQGHGPGVRPLFRGGGRGVKSDAALGFKWAQHLQVSG